MIYQNFNFDQSVLGVYLGGKTLMAGKITDGIIERKVVKEIDNFASKETILLQVIEIIAEIIDDDVVRIGIGVPSLVDVYQGIVYNAITIPSWQEVHLKEILEDRFKMCVYLNNDANCFAIGQKYFGKAKNFTQSVGLILSTGIGCGIVAGNQLISGANCGAGEIGTIPYQDFDYEYYCSESFFQKKYNEEYIEFLNRAESGDKVALALFEHYGTIVGDLIQTIIFAYDPEIIVMGGRMTRAYPFFKKTMLQKLKRFPYPKTIAKLQIEISDISEIGILGAAALCYNAMEK